MDATSLASHMLKPGGGRGGRAVGRVSCVPALLRVGADRRWPDIVQVSRWLGHHSPGFTLDVYAHLIDEGVGAPLDLDRVGSGSGSGVRERSAALDREVCNVDLQVFSRAAEARLAARENF
jgi:hypothetical protein